MLGKRLSLTEDVVQSHLHGLCASESHVRLLDGFPQIRVAVNAGRRENEVALVSGGGSGHEPAFAGYVGDGMLTAAVCGDVFAAPSAEAVLAAIRSVTTDAGCLLLPINYTGDRLNFALAAERAAVEGLRVETVLINDDCAVTNTGRVGRRGLAGSILVIKLVGAMAKRGTGLHDLAEFARKVVGNLGTMGVGLDTCGLPGQPREASRLEEDEIELGLGIHGEPGAEKLKDLSAESVVDRMVQKIVTYDPSPFKRDVSVGLLVNNLGGMAVMDLNAFAQRAVHAVRTIAKHEIAFTLIGTFLTSVSVAGFSITLLKMEPEYGELLLESTNATAWTMKHLSPYAERPMESLPRDLDKEETQAEELTALGSACRRALEAAVNALIASEGALNELDKKVGDGDCGSTLVKACAGIKADMDTYPFNKPKALLMAVGRSVGFCSGGTTGALYNVFLGFGSLRMTDDPAQAGKLEDWVTAFECGMEAMQKYGWSQPGDRTMLDAMQPACQALRECIGADLTLKEKAERVCSAAMNGVETTKEMKPAAGRATTLREREELWRGVSDPGAKAVAIWISAIAESLTKDSSG